MRAKGGSGDSKENKNCRIIVYEKSALVGRRVLAKHQSGNLR